MKYVNALVAVALALGCGTVQAVNCPADTPIKNPGFECNSLTNGSGGGLYGWTKGANVAANIITSRTSPGFGTPTYTSGVTPSNHFLVISSGNSFSWQTVTQQITLLKGQIISGNAGFDWEDYGDFVDRVRVAIFSGWTIAESALLATPFTQTGADFPVPTYPRYPAPPSYITDPYSNFYNGPWTPWSWTAPTLATGYTDGKYTLEYAVINQDLTGNLDSSFPSYGLFDILPIAVPEPASLALFVIGLASLGTMQRRRAL